MLLVQERNLLVDQSMFLVRRQCRQHHDHKVRKMLILSLINNEYIFFRHSFDVFLFPFFFFQTSNNIPTISAPSRSQTKPKRRKKNEPTPTTFPLIAAEDGEQTKPTGPVSIRAPSIVADRRSHPVPIELCDDEDEEFPVSIFPLFETKRKKKKKKKKRFVVDLCSPSPEPPLVPQTPPLPQESSAMATNERATPTFVPVFIPVNHPLAVGGVSVPMAMPIRVVAPCSCSDPFSSQQHHRSCAFLFCRCSSVINNNRPEALDASASHSNELV